MFSSSTPLFADAFLLHSTNIRASERFKTSQKKVKLKAHDNFTCIAHSSTPSTLSSFSTAALYKSIPLAASIAILLWSNPGTPLVNYLFHENNLFFSFCITNNGDGSLLICNLCHLLCSNGYCCVL